MHDIDAVDPSFLKFLALKRGARLHDARDAWNEIKDYRQIQAAAVARRLTGKRDCVVCAGSGKMPVHECIICGGTGKVNA